MKARTLRQLWRTSLVTGLLPLALGSSAQTAPQWNGRPLSMSSFAAVVSTTPISTVRPPTNLYVSDYEAIATAMTTEGNVPGMAMAIVQGGRVLTARGYGVTDVSNPQSIDAHTVFRLASLSKAFASAVTGVLVNDGVLRWDSRLTDYLPSFQLSQPGAAEQLTVADILSQRTGLERNTFDRDIEGNAAHAILGEPERAALLLGAAEANWEAAGVPVLPFDQPNLHQARVGAQSALGDDAFAEAYASGRTLPQAAWLPLTYALAEAVAARRPGQVVERLTRREREVLHLLSLGMTDQEIAAELHLSRKTVMNHHYAIKRKLDVGSDIELVHLALRLALIDVPGMAGGEGLGD